MFTAYAPRLAPSVAASRIHLAAVAPIRPHALVQLQRLTLQHYSVSRPVVCSAAVEDAPPAEPSNRLFVGNLSYNTTAEGLGKHFATLDGFLAANVAFDPRRQASRGFGFVEFESVEAAQRAREAMSESELDGRNLLVQPAQVRERRERRDNYAERGERGDRYADRGDRYGDRGDRYGDRRERGDRYGDRGDRYGDRGDREDFPRREQRQFAPGTRVWVSNLPFSAEWTDIKDAFRSVGQVEFVDIVMRRREGRLMKSGSAVVAFQDPETAERAVSEMAGFDMGGRELNVRLYNDEQ